MVDSAHVVPDMGIFGTLMSRSFGIGWLADMLSLLVLSSFWTATRPGIAVAGAHFRGGRSICAWREEKRQGGKLENGVSAKVREKVNGQVVRCVYPPYMDFRGSFVPG